MNYARALLLAVKKQNIDRDLSKIPFNVFLSYSGDVLSLCFLEEETDTYLIVAETNIMGGEELRIIPKENIEYIGLCYGTLETEEEEEDIMFV